MITIQEVKEIADRCGLVVDFSPGERDSFPADTFWMGEYRLRYLVHFDFRHRNFYLGNSLITRRRPWESWFALDDGEIAVLGISLEWWRKHKPGLQEMVALIESKYSGPVNCRPDICL